MLGLLADYTPDTCSLTRSKARWLECRMPHESLEVQTVGQLTDQQHPELSGFELLAHQMALPAAAAGAGQALLQVQSMGYDRAPVLVGLPPC